MSCTEILPLHPAQQQKFWNEERIEMAMVSTALDLATTQVQMQEEYFPTPIPSPVASPSGSYTDTQYYCNTELQALPQGGLDHQHLSPVPVSVQQYPTCPSSPPDSGIYCSPSPYRNDSYSPSPHGSPAAVTTTVPDHFSQHSYAYYPTSTTDGTFGLGEHTSVAPLVTPFDSTISLGSGCYLQAFMQSCIPQLTSFDSSFQACIPHCGTATSPIPRSSSMSSIESDAHQIQMFDTNKQHLLGGDTLEFYPPTPPSPDTPPKAPCSYHDLVAFPPMPTNMLPAPLPPFKPTCRGLKSKNQRKPPKPPVQVDDSDIKDIPTSAQLWEFTLRVLCKPKYAYMVSWENQKEGLFRFHDAPAFAALWGKHRNRPSMTYDKVARALRYYYKRDIFNQVGGRLTYRFSKRLSKLYAPE